MHTFTPASRRTPRPSALALAVALATSVALPGMAAAQSVTVTGDVTPGTPVSPDWNAGILYVGVSGVGSVSLLDGASLSSILAYVGYGAGSQGSVTLTDSLWTLRGNLLVGYGGSGSVVLRGSQAALAVGVSSTLALGRNAGSHGRLVLDADDAGLGSSVTLSSGSGGNLVIGDGGTGELVIGRNSTLSTGATNVILGGQAGGHGVLTLTDGGTLQSTFVTSGHFVLPSLFVGDSGTGVLDIGADDLRGTAGVLPAIGPNGITGGDGPNATATGVHGGGVINFNQTDSFGLGTKLSGNLALNQRGYGTTTLTGANAINGDVVINHGKLLVNGANGGFLNNYTDFAQTPEPAYHKDTIVGRDAGDDGTLLIAGGHYDGNAPTYTAYTRNATLGDMAGSSGHAAVSGAGSAWGITGTTWVGKEGTGTLAVSDGGTVKGGPGAQLSIGHAAGGSGVVTVTGSGSSITNLNTLYVGNAGTGTLTIAGGGRVQSSLSLIGSASGGSGTVTVTGSGSSLTTGALYLNAGTLDVAGGGTIGTNVVQSRGTLVVDGLLAPTGPAGVLTLQGGSLLSGQGTISHYAVTAAAGAATKIVAGAAGDPGALHFDDSTLALSDGSVLRFEIQDDADFGQLLFSGASGGAALNGLLEVSLLPGASFTAGERFTLLETGSAAQLTGAFDTLALPTGWQLDISDGRLSVIAAAPVPEPSSWVLLLAGLGVMRLRRRR